MKELSRSTFDFKTLIENGCVYVDKTDFLYRLARSEVDARYFISRPRRFGKSLMLSTLKYLFSGRRDLFRGLKIEQSDYDFGKSYPVISLDMAAAQANSAAALEQDLRSRILDDARENGVELRGSDYPSAKMLFGAYLRAMADKSEQGKVVVLIDEYDAPVTRLLDVKEECLRVQEAMHDFYIQLKSHDSRIRFLMLTGVSKFAKLSVFSGLNNLVDLSDLPEFASMLGYTREEMDGQLREHVEAFAQKRGLDYAGIQAVLLDWYDSYRFSPQSDVRVCNPVSLAYALIEQDVKNYWEKTGNSKMVHRLLAERIWLPEDLSAMTIRTDDLDVCPIDSWMKPAFLYQCGYLTIKERKEPDKLVLGIPNREIEHSLKHGFMSYLLGENADELLDNAKNARVKLASGVRVDAIIRETLRSAFELLPYDWRCESEAAAKRMFLFFCRFLGASIIGERHTAIGRADAILELQRAIYILEFKYDGTAAAALQQIKDRRYADSYLEDSRKIYLVGVNYSSVRRTIDDPVIEVWDRGCGQDPAQNSSGSAQPKVRDGALSAEVDGSALGDGKR